MNDDTLLGYLLDALDRDARRAVEAHLRTHPEVHARLAQLGRLVEPLAADADAPEPPTGLAESTLAHIAGSSWRRLPAAPPPRRSGAFPRWSLRRADLVTAALVLVLAAGLGLTWLARQWRDYRVLACQNNLHRLWTALQIYADEHPADGGAFPRVEPTGPRSFAGVFVPALTDAGALGPDVTTVCPAQGGSAPPPCSLAELDALARNQPCEYRARVRELGGDYAYTLGYRRGDDVVGLSRDCGDLLPILADRPRRRRRQQPQPRRRRPERPLYRRFGSLVRRAKRRRRSGRYLSERSAAGLNRPARVRHRARRQRRFAVPESVRSSNVGRAAGFIPAVWGEKPPG